MGKEDLPAARAVACLAPHGKGFVLVVYAKRRDQKDEEYGPNGIVGFITDNKNLGQSINSLVAKKPEMFRAERRSLTVTGLKQMEDMKTGVQGVDAGDYYQRFMVTLN